MVFIELLSAITILYLALGTAIWVRTRNLAFPVGLALLYYWTLYGAWFIVVDRLRGYSFLRYEYLYAKLFPVYLDESYLWTIAVYGFFLLALEIPLLLFARRLRIDGAGANVPSVSHFILIGIGVIAGLASFFVIRGSLASAAQMSVSSYEFVRVDDQAAGSYKIYQMLMRAALFSVSVGLVAILSGKNARVLRAKPSKWAALFYVVLLGGLFILNYKLGQRRAVASEAIAAGLFYLANVPRASRLLLGGAGLLMVVAMGLVSMTRGGSVAPGKSLSETVKDSITENLVSNEPFAAHLSLYGSIAYKLPPTYGSSLVYLAASLVPGISRPTDIYEYYADNVKSIEGQGYNVHHATGWYLNFGVAGVIAGAILLGFIWAMLFVGFQLRNLTESHIFKTFLMFGIWSFTASLASITRTGPEGYKGLLLEVAVVPTAIMVLATLRPVMRLGRVTVAPAHQWGIAR